MKKLTVGSSDRGSLVPDMALTFTGRPLTEPPPAARARGMLLPAFIEQRHEEPAAAALEGHPARTAFGVARDIVVWLMERETGRERGNVRC